MSLRDGVILTFLNTVICLIFPKLLSIILSTKKNSHNSGKTANQYFYLRKYSRNSQFFVN